jgi:hypothetical protein
MSDASSGFTGQQWQLVRALLQQRYATPVALEPIEADIGAEAEGMAPSSYPGLYWSGRDAHFVVIKTAPDRYRGQFFYASDEMFGPGQRDFDELDDCVLTLLRLQADHERQQCAGLPNGPLATEPDAGDDQTRKVG